MCMLDLSRLFFRISAYARGKWAEEMRPLSVAYTKKTGWFCTRLACLHLLTKQILIVSNILGTVNLAHRHLGRICKITNPYSITCYLYGCTSLVPRPFFAGEEITIHCSRMRKLFRKISVK